MHPRAQSVACVRFLQWALPRAGLNWRGYRRVRGTVCKRLHRRMAELALDSHDAYRDFLEQHPGEWRRFDVFCRIPISRFYRDREVFKALGKTIVPDLAQSALARGDRTLRVWCVGCAAGEEVYSLALLWVVEIGTRFPGLGLDLLGTDAEPHMLKRAQAGCFEASSLKELPADWRNRGFDEKGSLLCVKEQYRHLARWAGQDIRQQMPSGRFDAICCRNMAFTYFDDATQRQVLDRLTGHLVHRGILVIGGHEQLPDQCCMFDQPIRKLPIYRLRPQSDEQ